MTVFAGGINPKYSIKAFSTSLPSSPSVITQSAKPLRYPASAPDLYPPHVYRDLGTDFTISLQDNAMQARGDLCLVIFRKGGIHLTQVPTTCSVAWYESESTTESSGWRGLPANLPGVSGMVCRRTCVPPLSFALSLARRISVWPVRRERGAVDNSSRLSSLSAVRK
jgi:hypothetical protein